MMRTTTPANAVVAIVAGVTWVACVAIVAIIASGCRGGPSSGGESAVTMDDSAGVAIIENTAPEGHAARGGWALSSDPVLSIGRVDGDADYLFSRIRSVHRLSDGRFVLADAATQLRFYDADGRFLRAAGPPGRGPGRVLALDQSRLPRRR